ncbi:hypothetical protein JRQ81_011322 [Phrynocephalus forsythii]|uniref:Uncharacterized protein n=1 Tax=Phrynocephalus forsythii TaxID=171643 RepID=A0A9Q1ARI5_9SAUR|nr:hypothetical protein JRQ81_011322 [Phrynocephalus forsythii]
MTSGKQKGPLLRCVCVCVCIFPGAILRCFRDPPALQVSPAAREERKGPGMGEGDSGMEEEWLLNRWDKQEARAAACSTCPQLCPRQEGSFWGGWEGPPSPGAPGRWVAAVGAHEALGHRLQGKPWAAGAQAPFQPGGSRLPISAPAPPAPISRLFARPPPSPPTPNHPLLAGGGWGGAEGQALPPLERLVPQPAGRRAAAVGPGRGWREGLPWDPRPREARPGARRERLPLRR